jgi:hypothetical protein
MAKWNRGEIQKRAREELEASGSGGIRYMELAKKIHSATPETPFNSIVGSLHDLSVKSPDIVRPNRGLWVLKKYAEGGAPIEPLKEEIVETPARRAEEQTYYEPFAQWLVGEDQVIEAMVVGGSTFRDKWATPDVIGTYKARKSDLVHFPLEIVSAEIKQMAGNLSPHLVKPVRTDFSPTKHTLSCLQRSARMISIGLMLFVPCTASG